ncbi:hypothetical protein Tco_0144961 [Tanacetum coccineum]
MSFMKNLDDTFNFGDQFLHDKPTEDDQEKSKVREEFDSTIPDTSHQTVTSIPPVIREKEITPFIALQLRVARLEQEMSEVKKTDHSADVLASIESQVPTALSLSTDKVALEEFDLKSALFKHMNKISVCKTRNYCQIRLYHALMEAFEYSMKMPWIRKWTFQCRDEGLTQIWRTLDNAHFPGPVDYYVSLNDSWKAKDQHTLKQEWTIPTNDFPEPEILPGQNTYAYKYKRKKKLLQSRFRSPAVNLDNPEGHQILRNVYEPLPLGGPPGQVAVSSSLRLLEPKRTIESRAKRSSINLVRTQHPSETMVFHNEDGNPARANIKQALGSYERPHKGVKASANSDVMYFFTSAQDGDPLQDDVRLCLGDDLKKAQDHSQRQV